MAEQPWLDYILNNTRKPKERWRFLNGGMGWCHEPEDSPLRVVKVAKGMLQKSKCCGHTYTQEMSLDLFFKESDAPLEAKRNARDWLVASGYSDWLKQNNLFLI